MKLLLGELEIHDSQLATNPSLMIDRIWKKKLDLIMNYTVYGFFFSAWGQLSPYHSGCSISGGVRKGVLSVCLSKGSHRMQCTADNGDRPQQ